MFYINHHFSVIELLGSEAAPQLCEGFVSLVDAVMVLDSGSLPDKNLTCCTLSGEKQEVGVQGQTTNKTQEVW